MANSRSGLAPTRHKTHLIYRVFRGPDSRGSSLLTATPQVRNDYLAPKHLDAKHVDCWLTRSRNTDASPLLCRAGAGQA